MIKRIDHFLKSYFIFSRNERKGVLFLLALLILIISLPAAYQRIFPPEPMTVSITDLPLETVVAGEAGTGAEPETFPFDPNTAGVTDLQRLGFSAKNIQTIERYRSKGGRFKNAADLGKLYGMDQEVYTRLEPSIRIPEKNAVAMADSSVHRKKPQGVVELNSADSLQLVSLYRIGPALTHRILEHRAKLGGFVSRDQLMEIWGFDEDILFDLNDRIRVDASKVRIFNVNTVTLEELRSHPYFKYKLSNAIINYRLQHGRYETLQDLKKIVLVNDSIYNRIIIYLKTD